MGAAAMRRCLLAWGRLCEERWWKTQLELRDQQAQMLASQLRHIEARPVRYIRRLRMKRWLQAWTRYLARQQAKRAAAGRAAEHAERVLAGRALEAWTQARAKAATKAAAGQRAAQLHLRRRRLQAFAAWRQLVGRRARKQHALCAAQCMREVHLLRMALGRWRYLSSFYHAERRAVEERRRRRGLWALTAWLQRARWRATMAAKTKQVQARHAANLRHWTFFGWRAHVDGRLARTAHEEHERLRAEHEQLRQESERLARVIDSGDWGRDRVAELAQAGQVLQQERDALVKLVESLPGGRSRRASRLSVSGTATSTAATAATAAAAAAASLTAGGAASLAHYNIGNLAAGSRRGSLLSQPSLAAALAPPAAPAAPASASPGRGGAAAARNKLSVKTGSSFNALVRALKQDLLTSGTLGRDPAAAAAVDKVRAGSVAARPSRAAHSTACWNTILVYRRR
jgi:hypothetical protein